MPDYFVYRRNEEWFAKRNRHNGEEPKGEVFRIIAKTKQRAIAFAKKIVEDIEKMQVQAEGSTVSKSTEVKTEVTK